MKNRHQRRFSRCLLVFPPIVLTVVFLCVNIGQLRPALQVDPFFPSNEERLNFYLGVPANFSIDELPFPDKELFCDSLAGKLDGSGVRTPVKVDSVQSLNDHDLENCVANSSHPSLAGDKYCRDALRFFQTGVVLKSAFFSFGDATEQPSTLPTVMKARKAVSGNNMSRGVLWPLNVRRHYGPMHEISSNDIHWRWKRKRLVWRGTDTGWGKRARVVEPLFDAQDDTIDIAFHDRLGKQELIRDKLSFRQLLQNKYLLSLEGNDVSSGLKWMLYSNSVVFMPTPRYESWAMESLLRPYVHYIPVAEDLSDIVEKVNWAKSNDAQCYHISMRASRFMEAFFELGSSDNSHADTYMKRRVVEAYSTIVRSLEQKHCRL